MNPSESNVAIVAALRAALSAEITASIHVDGYALTITVMVDGVRTHHDDDLAAAAADLFFRVTEATAKRANA